MAVAGLLPKNCVGCFVHEHSQIRSATPSMTRPDAPFDMTHIRKILPDFRPSELPPRVVVVCDLACTSNRRRRP